MDEIEDDRWWTDRTRREMREIGDVRGPHAAERITSRAHSLAAETLVAIIRRLPPEQRRSDSPVLAACIQHLLLPSDNPASTSASLELLTRVTVAARKAFGALSEDELADFYFGFVEQHLHKQVLSQTDNRILEGRFWYRVHRRLSRFVAAERRKRHVASVVASSFYETSPDGAWADAAKDAAAREALMEKFREEVDRWLDPELAKTVRLWIEGYPISSKNPRADSIAKHLGITREAVSKRLRRASGLLSQALESPVVLLRRPRKPGAAGAGGTTEQEEPE